MSGNNSLTVEQTMSTEFVTEDHCEQVVLRIEGKIDALILKIDPKIDMIVRIDEHLKLFKWSLGLLFSGGFIGLVIALWKPIAVLLSMIKP